MANTYMLRSSEIWLPEAIEILADARRPGEWQACHLADRERSALDDYLTRLDRYVKQTATATTSEYDGYLAQMSLADLAVSRDTAAPPEQKPEMTPALIDIVERFTTRNGIVDDVWSELRQALVDGKLVASCFLEVIDNEDVPGDVWGKPPNAKAHISGRVFLRKKPGGSGLLGGRAFLRRQDLIDFICGHPSPSTSAVKAQTQHPLTGSSQPAKRLKASPKLDFAKELVRRAYPAGVTARDKTVEIVLRAQQQYRKTDTAARPSDDVIKRAVGRKK